MIRDTKRTRAEIAAERVPRVHLTVMGGLPDLLERFGVESAVVLRTENLTKEDFEDPQRSEPFEVLDRLLSTCVRRTRCEHFGLLLGGYVDLHSFGITGRLVRNAPSVGSALQDLRNYFVLHDTGGAPSIAIHDGTVTASYGIHSTRIRNTDQAYDLSVHALMNILRQLCGRGWRPDVVLLPRKRPAQPRPYRDIFEAPIRFDSLQAGLQFPTRWLNRAVEGADPLLHSLLRDRATTELAQQDPMLHGEVRRAITETLPNGKCSRASTARRLRMHPRTLGRRLQQSGTTFQRLLDSVRSDLAKLLLHDTRLPISRIAVSLGYQDPTVFTRAFRRWTGMTPREFRAGLPERW